MRQDEALAAAQEERLRLCGFLEDLDDADWATPSLCAGWTVRDVVAHLTIPTRATWLGVTIGAIKARGNFDRMAMSQAKSRASRFASTELLGQLRASAYSTRRMPGSDPMDPLIDLLVHGQDIARPLEKVLPTPVSLAVASLHVVADSTFFGGRKRFAGLRVVATDADWTSGSGPEVHGPAAELLLAATGRVPGLDLLAGSGVTDLRDRFDPADADGWR